VRYEGNIFRPPSEANSLLIQATIGCPHNKCAFCAMYKGAKFRMRDVEEIKEDMDMAAKHIDPRFVRTMFLPDANTIIMKTDKLLDICRHATSVFDRLERITVYGGARFVSRKSVDELKALHEAGLKRIHMGMESGDDEVLKKMKKGITADKITDAGQKVVQAGMELSEYYMVGLGGAERWKEHALESARVLSAINPHFIRLRTTVPIPGTELHEMFERGEWELPGPHQSLKEIRTLVENLECDGTALLSDHNSNYWDISGRLPENKEGMLGEIDRALEIDEAKFRPYWGVRL